MGDTGLQLLEIGQHELADGGRSLNLGGRGEVEGIERSSDSLAVALGRGRLRRRRPSPIRDGRRGGGHCGRRRRCAGGEQKAISHEER